MSASRSLFVLVLLFLFLSLLNSVNAGELPMAEPGEVGLSSERLARLDRIMQRYVDEEKLAGVLTLVARNGKIAHLSAIGKMDIENNSAMRNDTIFRLYSMTKPITSVAPLMLYEEGHFQLVVDTP